MGSGSLAAMAVFESRYCEGLNVSSKSTSGEPQIVVLSLAFDTLIWFNTCSVQKEEGINLVREAIYAGHKEYLRNYQVPNTRAYVSSEEFTFPKKTEVLLTKIVLLREKVVVTEDGDAMEE
ncbi:Myb26 family protein [Hibiscus syriacus]|uniref:Myb26 family protein n=1 Tax=Hibiscus syriacus TaxID=106335 RepID=A0A6A3BJV1_HIBSY|nr:Myb26 family protein [Hibiscus syriacus]